MTRLIVPELFILDANVFIESSKRYYAFDIAPGFWNALLKVAQTCKVKSLDRVRDEILRKRDALSEWVRNYFDKYFINTRSDRKVIDKYSWLMNWAMNHSHYNNNAKEEFAREDNADPWLLAYAMAYTSVTIVTGEQFKKGIKRKIPIPNACKELNLKCINTFDFLRKFNISLR